MTTLNNQFVNQTKQTALFAPRETHQPDVKKHSDIELLGKLLGVREAKRIYAGSLNTVFTDPAPEICRIARELLTRWLSEEIMTGDSMNTPQAVRDYLKMYFTGREYESFVAIFLDAQHRVISAEELFKGTLTQTSIYPREVVNTSLKHNAAAVIFAHNHPSGATEPS